MHLTGSYFQQEITSSDLKAAIFFLLTSLTQYVDQGILLEVVLKHTYCSTIKACWMQHLTDIYM